jgi:DNA-binding GntR family transcriptional regulator
LPGSERTEQAIRCAVLDPGDAALLEVPPLSPAFAVERTAYDARAGPWSTPRPYRGDRHTYNVTLHRAHAQHD